MITKFLKAFLLKNSAKFITEFAEFMQECEDFERNHYEIAVRFEGLNIEYLPSRKAGEKEGKNITVEWL